jgi:tetratricopeptide (TPR) repeat protein
MNEAIRLNPKNSCAISLRAAILYFQGQYDKAIDDCDRAIELAPRNAHAFSVRGDSWQAKKEYGKAMRDLDEAIRLNPHKASSYYDKACCHAVQGQTDAAIANLRKAVDLGYADFAHMAKDSDLISVRNDERYKAIMRKRGK